jgi:hypothetical protein
MYPRNNATPRPITVGPVVQISDGAVQTSGTSVEVSKDGGSFSAGGGTLAVSNGIHSYTPTQGETDCDSLRINVYKTGCIPATAQAVFSASSSFGYAGTDQSKIANPSSTVNLSGTTIKAVTDGVTVTTNNDKTGYSLTQAFPSNFASLAITAGGAVTVGTNNDKTGYALTQAFPSNFAALGITAGGAVTVGTNNDKTGYSLLVTPPTAATIADAVWDEAYASHTTAGTFGKLMDLLRKANTVVEGTVTSATSPTTTAFSSDVNYPTGAFKHAVLLWTSGSLNEQNSPILTYTNTNGAITVEEAFTAAPQVGDTFIIIPTTHVHAIAAIVSAIEATEVMTDLDTMIINDGTANARFSTSALQNAPSGGGGGTGSGARTVVVTVTLSASPVEGASVRLTKAAETYVGSTNASGQVTFNVDDGTWTVAITSPGATFAGASLVVDDDENVSYSLTAISITPSPATQITGYYTCYSHLGVVEAGVSITMQLVGLAQGSVGLALDNRLRTVTSDANGVAQFTNLFPGCRYKVYRGAAENKAWYVNLPDTVTGDPVELGSIYGDDE